MEKEVIIYFVGFAICLINMTYIFQILTGNKMKLSLKSVFMILFFSFLSIFVRSFNIIAFNTMFSLITLIIITYMVYKENDFDEALFFSIFIWLIGMILDIFFMAIFSLIFIKHLNISSTDIVIFFASMLLQLLYNLLSRIRGYKNIVLKINKNIKKIQVNKLIIYFIIIITILLGALAVYNLYNSLEIVLIFLLIVSVIILFLQGIKLKYIRIISKNTQEILIKNNDFYIKLNNKFRKFKHNLVHDLNAVKSVGTKKVKVLINEIIKDSGLSGKPFKEIDNLPSGLNGIVYSKLYQPDFLQLNIAIENFICSDVFKILNPRKYIKLCETIGVLLDNALEAALISEEKIVYIFLEETENYINITLKNTFSSFLELEKVGDINYSTKGVDRGLGLFSILFAKDIKVKTCIINNLFVSTISVKKQKNQEIS